MMMTPRADRYLSIARAVIGDAWDADPGVRTAVIRHAREYTTALRQLAVLTSRGDRQRRSHQKAVLRSQSGGVCNLIRAAHRLEQKFTLKQLEAWASTPPGEDTGEPAKLVLIEKPHGGHRPTLAFGVRNKAHQYQVQDVAKIVLNTSAHDYGMNGLGTHGAVQFLTNQINKEGRYWFYKADIRNCFGSFENERVVKSLPFDEAIIRKVILGEGLHVLGFKSLYSPSSAQPPLTGLIQGSPNSNLIASALLKPIFDALAAEVLGVGYADDFGACCYTKEEGYAVHQSLASQLAAHPAGELKLTGEIEIVTTGSPFLGYQFVQEAEGIIRPAPKPESVAAYLDRLGLILTDTTSWMLDEVALNATERFARMYRAWNPLEALEEGRFHGLEEMALEMAEEEFQRRPVPVLPLPLPTPFSNEPPWSVSEGPNV